MYPVSMSIIIVSRCVRLLCCCPLSVLRLCYSWFQLPKSSIPIPYTPYRYGPHRPSRYGVGILDWSRRLGPSNVPRTRLQQTSHLPLLPEQACDEGLLAPCIFSQKPPWDTS